MKATIQICAQPSKCRAVSAGCCTLDGEENKHGTRPDDSDRRTLGQTIVAMAQYAEELRHWIDAALFAAMEAKRPIQ